MITVKKNKIKKLNSAITTLKYFLNTTKKKENLK